MNELQIVGGVPCYEKEGVAYLKLEDVARGLGFTRIAESGNEVIRWERVDGYLSDLGVPTSGHGDFIPENIFYRLAMKAKNDVAEVFQAKVADEIIPAIRKHGAYMTPDTLQAAILNPDTMIQVCRQLKAEQEARQKLSDKVERDAPKVLFADAVSASHTSILVGELAKMLRQNGIDIGQNRMFAWLRENGYLVKRQGTDFNMPTQYSMDRELFEIKETVIQTPDGVRVNKTVKVTGKGQQFFISKILRGY